MEKGNERADGQQEKLRRIIAEGDRTPASCDNSRLSFFPGPM
jgi:hypothetical protein